MYFNTIALKHNYKTETRQNPLFATSGQLICKKDIDNHKKAFTSTYNFRMLMNFYDDNKSKRIAFTDSKFSVIAKVTSFQEIGKKVEWSGIHLFGRYQSENNLYVVSFRIDGTIVMKKKISGEYTTLKR